MRRLLTQVAILLLLLVFVCGPAYESYDHWDHFQQSADIVLGLDLLGLSVGAALAFAQFLLALTRHPVAPFGWFAFSGSLSLRGIRPHFLPLTASPPALRI